MRADIWQAEPVARPSIVPIALTLDDRTGYTLWAPPWEEDGEEWQAFLGTTEGDTANGAPVPDTGGAGGVLPHQHRPRPRRPPGLAGRARGSGAADLTPDDDHRFDLDGVYDIAAENPDRWAVEELAATIDIVSRLAECLDTARARRRARRRRDRGPVRGGRRARRQARDRLAGPRRGGLRRPLRRGRLARRRWRARRPLGGRRRGARRAPRLDRRGHGDPRGVPGRLGGRGGRGRRRRRRGADADWTTPPRPARPPPRRHRVSARSPGGSRLTADPAEVAAAAEFWEAVGILPVEIVVPEGAG